VAAHREVTVTIKCLASHAVVVGGVCLAIGAPSAGARPITDLPMHTAAPAHTAVAVASPDALQPQVRSLIRHDRAESGGRAAVDRTPASHVATGGLDWVALAIGGVAFATVLGLLWLAAAGISRVIRPRVAHR
jgi:hypothetical protein